MVCRSKIVPSIRQYGCYGCSSCLGAFIFTKMRHFRATKRTFQHRVHSLSRRQLAHCPTASLLWEQGYTLKKRVSWGTPIGGVSACHIYYTLWGNTCTPQIWEYVYTRWCGAHVHLFLQKSHTKGTQVHPIQWCTATPLSTPNEMKGNTDAPRSKVYHCTAS